jgi:FMN reductase
VGYTAVVVGNPKANSRTLRAAISLAERLTGPVDPDHVVDLASLDCALLHGGDDLTQAVDVVLRASLLVVASPTYKATYTGILKMFLDRIPTGGLAGVRAVAFMVGGAPQHALAAEVHLRPVLVELGASCPTRALFLTEQSVSDPACFDEWLIDGRRLLSQRPVVVDRRDSAH